MPAAAIAYLGELMKKGFAIGSHREWIGNTTALTRIWTEGMIDGWMKSGFNKDMDG